MKIKFGIKIEFLKITGTGNLIPKNMGDKKKLQTRPLFYPLFSL
jgi:hypothetical protein